MLDDTGDDPSPCVYILDVDTLVWTRNVTHAPEDEHNPGARSLHVTTVCLCLGSLGHWPPFRLLPDRRKAASWRNPFRPASGFPPASMYAYVIQMLCYLHL
jgi:hypothetical protein